MPALYGRRDARRYGSVRFASGLRRFPSDTAEVECWSWGIGVMEGPDMLKHGHQTVAGSVAFRRII